MRSGFTKVLLLFAILVCAAASGYLLISSEREEEKTERELEAAGEEYRIYGNQIRDLENQLKEKKEELEAQEKGYIILAFSSENPQLMEEISPALKEYGFHGTLVCTVDEFPLTEMESQTREKIQKLQEEGWDFALGGAIGENPETYAEKIQNAWSYFQDNGFGTIQSLMFNGGDYADGRDTIYPVISELGFQLCGGFSSKEGYTSLISEKDTDYPQIYNCQNISLREDIGVIKAMAEQAAYQKKPLIFSDYTLEQSWENAEAGNLENLRGILQYLKEEEQVETGNVQEYLEYSTHLEQTMGEKEKEYQVFEEKCREEISGLRQKQAEIGK